MVKVASVIMDTLTVVNEASELSTTLLPRITMSSDTKYIKAKP